VARCQLPQGAWRCVACAGIVENRGRRKPRVPSLSRDCPDSRLTPHASPATARFARRRRNSGPPPLLPPGCPPAATHAYSMSLRSLSSSPAVWPSCPASARARSPRAGGRVRPAVHGFLRQVKIRPPPSSSPPPPFSFLICSLPFLPPPVPIQNPSAPHGSPARCICFPLGLTPRAEQ
jgi:hypothetical protein